VTIRVGRFSASNAVVIRNSSPSSAGAPDQSGGLV
jgi:hypothetical protein